MILKVYVDSFWKGFEMNNSLFDISLKNIYEIQYVNNIEKADLVFMSYFSNPSYIARFKRIKGRYLSSMYQKRIFFSGEPFELPKNKFHGVISYHSQFSNNHFRLPLWVLYCNFWDKVISPCGVIESNFTPNEILNPIKINPNKFACAIFSNKQDLRLKAVDCLSKYGKVEIFGRSFNKPVNNKIEVMKDYKFNLCFENSLIPGYVTEKALHAKIAGTIPLWWGDSTYRLDFNEKSLINVYEYDFNFEKIFDEVDFNEIRNTPLISKIPHFYLEDLSIFFNNVINNDSKSLF
jgi:hypothetical protein